MLFLLAVLFLAACGAGAVYLVTGGLSRVEVGVFAIVAMLTLVLSGMHLASALILLSFLGIWMIRGTVAVAEGGLAIATTGSINSYAFAVIPLFVLMGLFIEIADVGRDAFSVLARLLRRIRGGLGVATVFANAIFAAITGSSIASATVFTRVATPPMMAHGYTSRFAVGVVAGSSVLGMLIPPSILLLIYRADRRGVDRGAVHGGDPAGAASGLGLRGACAADGAFHAGLRRGCPPLGRDRRRQRGRDSRGVFCRSSP